MNNQGKIWHFSYWGWCFGQSYSSLCLTSLIITQAGLSQNKWGQPYIGLLLFKCFFTLSICFCSIWWTLSFTRKWGATRYCWLCLTLNLDWLLPWSKICRLSIFTTISTSCRSCKCWGSSSIWTEHSSKEDWCSSQLWLYSSWYRGLMSVPGLELERWV